MKKIMVFAGFMGALMVSVANAALSGDSRTYLGFSVADGTKDAKQQVATVKYVDTHVHDVSSDVVNLDTRATETKATVDANTDAVADLKDNRQVTPSVNECNIEGGERDIYSGCGYIAIDGEHTDGQTSSDYVWMKIIK